MMIAMNKRGIANQDIPQCHEVSMENNRLHASILSPTDKDEKAIEEYIAFLVSVENVHEIFDPLAIDTTRVKYTHTLKKLFDSKGNDQINQAKMNLS